MVQGSFEMERAETFGSYNNYIDLRISPRYFDTSGIY